MRQGGAPPTGKWQGSATGGVKAPQPILLPDPKTRFAKTAARLEALEQRWQMSQWCSFMASLAHAQHAAALAIGLPAAMDEDAITQAVAQRVPPLAPESHVRDPMWRRGLHALLDNLEEHTSLAPLMPALSKLRGAEADEVEALAGDFLHGSIGAKDAGNVVYLAAALQVYFTALAATLPVDRLRLLPNRALCPCCGSTSVAGVITATGDAPGVRYLYCSLCSTAWNHVRAVCITCEGSEKVELWTVEGGGETVRAEICQDCGTYSKVLYQAKDMQTDPYADDLATLWLDMRLGEDNWARHAPNPLVLIGAD